MEGNSITFPLVSIIIPVFNGSKYLAGAIESALNQTYNNIEVVVVNDGSTDDGATRAVCLSYGEQIRYFEKDNGGVSSALNLGISVMRGEYFSWLSHDDLYLPEKIQNQLDFLGANPTINICYSNVKILDEDSGILRTYNCKPCSPDDTFPRLLTGNFINGCTLLIPRYAFNCCGVFDEKLKTAQDFELWTRFASKYKFALVPEELVIYRKHRDQDSVRKAQLHRIECDRTHSKILKREDVQGYLNAFKQPLLFYFGMVVKLHSHGHRQSASYALKLAWKFNRTSYLAALPIHLVLEMIPWPIIFMFGKSLGSFRRKILLLGKIGLNLNNRRVLNHGS